MNFTHNPWVAVLVSERLSSSTCPGKRAKCRHTRHGLLPPPTSALVSMPALRMAGRSPSLAGSQSTHWIPATEDGDGDRDLDTVCNGDSGGPLMWMGKGADGRKWPTVVGIVSWGPGSCESAGWAAYTNVAAMKPWICETLRKDFRLTPLEIAGGGITCP